MITKICSTCKITKDISEFRFRKDKQRFVSCCKKCESKGVMNTRDPKKLKERRAKYYKDNKDREKKNYQIYRQNNKEYFRQRYYNYYMNNKTILMKRRLQNIKTRRKLDPAFKLRMNVSSMIKNRIKKNGKSILNYLPYSIQQLKDHLEQQFEPWMTWNNWGIYNLSVWNDQDQSTWKWQIDHIIPQSTLPYTSMEDDNFKKCWSLENLRPLSAKQNLLDGVNRVRH